MKIQVKQFKRHFPNFKDLSLTVLVWKNLNIRNCVYTHHKEVCVFMIYIAGKQNFGNKPKRKKIFLVQDKIVDSKKKSIL